MTTNKTTTMPPRSDGSRPKAVFEDVLDSVYGHRVVLYGPGGVGKSTLACMMEGETAFVDADESLEKLKRQLTAQGIKIPKKVKATNWTTLRAQLQSPGWDKVRNIVLDTWAPIELWCLQNTLANVKKDGGSQAASVEDYGYGKGYRHLYDTFLRILGDLDAHVRAGRNVIIVAHDETCKIPNPAGQDFLRWEPKMQHTEKASIRYRMKEWADHVLFLCYDTDVMKVAGDGDGRKIGKAKGQGTRSLYTAEQPHFMAKSRTTCEKFDVELGASPWGEIIC